MSITSQNQIIVFILCVFCGIIIGIIYDLFRIHRTFFKVTNSTVIIADCFFWLIASILSFQFIMLSNNGNLRLFEFLGFLAGFFIHFSFISKAFTKITVLLFKLLNKASKFILKIIFLPILFFIKVFRKPYFLLIYGFKANYKRLIRFSKKI